MALLELFRPVLTRLSCSHSTSVFFRSAGTALTKTEGWCAERGVRTTNRKFVPPVMFSSLQLDFSRPKPYDRPQKVPDSAPPPGVGWPPAPRGHPPPKQVDSSTFAGLFQQLIPIAVNEPVAFESKASAICASFDLDPTTSEDIINSVKQQFPAVRNQDTTCVSSVFLHIRPLTSVLSVSPPSSGPTNIELAANPAPASAPTPPNTLPPPPTTLETPLVPVKQRRQFSCGSPAYTIWYFTASAQSLTFPPQEVTPMVGDLYIHHNRLEDIYQVWLYGIDLAWKSVTDVEKVYHPTIDDRVLSMRANGTPNWITTASFTTIRGRKCKRVQVD